MVGFSRIALGAHFLTDVLAATLVRNYLAGVVRGFEQIQYSEAAYDLQAAVIFLEDNEPVLGTGGARNTTGLESLAHRRHSGESPPL